ncbi:MAG: hypothetical protein QM714_02685 [Nocardioides sp.]|uniref:hypothetical protein n=1 Tax=Nocardioides sp. TaxID=35761 RepID=UPI0039E3F1E7
MADADVMMRPFLIEFIPERYRTELDAAFAAAEKAANDEGSAHRIGDTAGAELRQKYDTILRECVVSVWARPLARSVHRGIKASHPPQPPKEGEERPVDRIGLDLDAAEDDLLYAGLVDPATVDAAVPAPLFKTRAAFDEWADSRAPGFLTYIASRIWAATTEVWVDPKSLPASPTRNTSSS